LGVTTNKKKRKERPGSVKMLDTGGGLKKVQVSKKYTSEVLRFKIGDEMTTVKP